MFVTKHPSDHPERPALSHRSDEFRLQQHRSRIQKKLQGSRAVDFFNLLTGPELLEKTETLCPEYRERLYPPTVALSMFMGQALNEDGSCQKAVDGWAAQCAVEGLNRPISTRTGGYCKARQRLEIEMIKALVRETGSLLSGKAIQSWRWRERLVKLADGTTISMPDTEENQRVFPQPSTQAKGVGFPLALVSSVICLSTGAVIDAAMGPYAGKGNSEIGLFRGLLSAFSAGDVVLADSYYSNYFVIAALQGMGVDVVFQQFGARITDFRRGKSLGKRDHRVGWKKPKAKPGWMTQEQYDDSPSELLMREVEVDGRILVTTLLDHRDVHKAELSELHAMRWNVELDLRNLKTTMGMAELSCHTPQMNEKEFWVHLLAYNLIRILMAQAALHADMHPRQISFKHTVQMWTEWTARGLINRSVQHNAALFVHIAQLKVGDRPGRVEPRARKRRPKPYPWLKVPRAEARRKILWHGHL